VTITIDRVRENFEGLENEKFVAAPSALTA
jgi:hypothetical protein